jgi:hypothetical protein
VTFIDGVVLTNLRPFVHVAFIEDIVERLTASVADDSDLETILEDLRAKYVAPKQPES